MTISSETIKLIYTGNDAVSVYPYTWKINDDDDLRVSVVKISDGVETLLTKTTDYTVSGVGVGAGGNVTLVNASQAWLTAGKLSSAYKLVIESNEPYTQLTDYAENDPFPAETHEAALDHQVRLIQQVKSKLDRALLMPVTESSAPSVPTLTSNALKFLRVTAAGTGLEWAAVTATSSAYNAAFSSGLDASKPASPTAGDLYLAIDTAILYKCFTAGTWSAWTNHGKGADIASATTTDIGASTGEYVEVTGTTTITGLGTISAGVKRIVRFTGALTLTHNATSLILPGGANITTAAGDVGVFVSLGSGNWRCVSYVRADGRPINQVKASDVASAATVDLSAVLGDFVDVTGTTTITAFGTAAAGVQKVVRFTGALTLTHNGTSLILPGGANITTAAGDVAVMRSLGSGNWVCVSYTKASGLPVISETGAKVKMWVKFDGSGTVTINNHLNCSSITDNGAGDWTVNSSYTFASVNWGVAHAVSGPNTSNLHISQGTQTTTAIRVVCRTLADAPNDSDEVHIWGIE